MNTRIPGLNRTESQTLISLALVLLSCGYTLGAGYAASQPDDLAAYEQSLFSRSYEDESLPQRLDRLENSVFGESSPSENPSQRQARLSKALGAARKAIPGAVTTPAETAPAENTQGISGFSSPQNRQNVQSSAPQTAPATAAETPRVSTDATDYPTVTAIERQVFGRDFVREEIHHRLDRVERKVFGQNYPQTELVDRVDKLLGQYPNVSPHTSPPAASDDYAAGSAIRNLPDDPSEFMGSSRDVYAKVDALEKKVFNGKTSPNALLTERLDRLEAQILTRKYSGESVDTRVSRLLREFEIRPGYQARPGFQPRPSYVGTATQNSVSGLPQVMTPGGYSSGQSSSSVSSPGPQNIQIGAGMSQNSTYQFSPEMMSMLPPSVRGQMSGSRQSGTVVSAPSTVVIEQTTTTPGYSPGFNPGFQPYGNQPMQYYNYYGSPATQMQSQTTTTVLQPDGSAAVYSYPGASTIPGNPNGLPNPAYVGDPAFLQSLNNLESHVFGQINTVDPVYLRLGKLESALLGQMYVGYPEGQRLNNLERAYQVKAVGKLLGQSSGRTPGSPMLGIPLNAPSPMNVPPIPMNMGMPGR